MSLALEVENLGCFNWQSGQDQSTRTASIEIAVGVSGRVASGLGTSRCREGVWEGTIEPIDDGLSVRCVVHFLQADQVEVESSNSRASEESQRTLESFPIV